MKSTLVFTMLYVIFALSCPLLSVAGADSPARDILPMDADWRFAFGHPYDARKDFNNGTGYFSYFAKAGYGDGPAATNFDDQTWRTLDLPHDWAVEVPFDGKAGHSHGYKAIGRNFPEASVGWYRKSFDIPQSDLGRCISIEFDGVMRDSVVWINGHYLGHEPSGYSSFSFDITDYLNYGGKNTVAVRVDVTIEEGWFYEGAGIYRHVRLVKTSPLHVAPCGTFVYCDINKDDAIVTTQVTIVNKSSSDKMFDIEQNILDAESKSVASEQAKSCLLKSGDSNDFSCDISVKNPKLWSLESPYLHTLVTTIRSGGKVVDTYETPFGVRTIRFDANEGFFLNGKSVKLKGTNVHQDHAGVGAAIPDALQDFRISSLKKFGSNTYRCSHNPPTPQLLDACDRLGMLVIDENRLMGTTPEIMGQLKRLILRDRNHPSVILWSLGNEEWGIEGNITGARITSTMQAFAKYLDPTRQTTVAVSGGWGAGISTVVDVMGYNYISHGSTDDQHAKFPDQPGVGTEETSTQATRGIYFTDKEKAHLAPRQKGDSGGNCEVGWKYYAARPYLAGLCYWTGFDYRGEPTPFGFPAISSQFGILDTCGFPKDSFYYLKSWWTDETVLHIFPHWNWKGKEGQQIDVWCFSNCDEVELFLNDKSLGKKTMEKNSHLEWEVKYEPGTLLAKGFKGGNEIVVEKVETVDNPAVIQLTADRLSIKADRQDVSVITVRINDAKERFVPTAGNEIIFAIDGPGKIIGIGNGDPSCHEPDVFLAKQSVRVSDVGGWKWKLLSEPKKTDIPEIETNFDDSDWAQHDARAESGPLDWGQGGVFRCYMTLSKQDLAAEKVLLRFGMIDDESWVYVNGQKAGESHDWHAAPAFDIKSFLHTGKNTIAMVVTNKDGRGGMNLGSTLVLQEKTVLPQWKRSVFNGLAQVIVQSTQEPGQITLTAESAGLKSARLKIQTQQ
jgi:beta-galactosidase